MEEELYIIITETMESGVKRSLKHRGMTSEICIRTKDNANARLDSLFKTKVNCVAYRLVPVSLAEETVVVIKKAIP